jgi:hypothetical protein
MSRLPLFDAWLQNIPPPNFFNTLDYFNPWIGNSRNVR